MCGNYSREETIQERKLYEEIQHADFTIGNWKSKKGSIIIMVLVIKNCCFTLNIQDLNNWNFSADGLDQKYTSLFPLWPWPWADFDLLTILKLTPNVLRFSLGDLLIWQNLKSLSTKSWILRNIYLFSGSCLGPFSCLSFVH